MSFQSFLNILLIVGFIQGIITSFLLRKLKTNTVSNKILSWIILLISMACLNIYFVEAVELESTIWIILGAILPLVIIMPCGPLIYFYIQATLDINFKISKKDKKHFYTLIFDLFPYLLSLLLIIFSVFGLLENNTFDWSNFIYKYNKYVDAPRWISLTIYLYLSYKFLSKSNQKNKNNPIYKWLKQFLIGFLIFSAIWLIHLVPYLIPSLSDKLLGAVGWYPIYLPLIILIYWLGINGYIISFKYLKTFSSNNKLTKTVVENTLRSLDETMKVDQLFLNPNLKLNNIVEHTQISQKTISAVLNQHLGKSFNEYVNEFRIEEFKSRLVKNQDKNLTITGIALECGFNSQATFQRTFKLMTNMTPKEFQKSHFSS